jgi:site-specific recombinase XerD
MDDEKGKVDRGLAPVKRAQSLVRGGDGSLPVIVERSSSQAAFAWEEFFAGEVRNAHTRRAYERAVRSFLGWCEGRGLELAAITPGQVGAYLDQLGVAAPSKKLGLAALRKFFDRMVVRHAMLLNPAHSVRTERHHDVEGKTQEISKADARTLLASIDTNSVVGLRDRAIVAILIYTAARVGAVAKLKLKDFHEDGTQFCLRFSEKRGKSRAIPVRHDLEQYLLEYLEAAGTRGEPGERPLFRTAVRRTRLLTREAMTGNDVGRMVKRRLEGAGLSPRLSPHSFRVATITDLLEQGVPLEDVQHLAGHSDPRTTRLYDRRQRRVTRNVVERISI